MPNVSGQSLELDGVSRRFGAVVAVDDVSLSVPAGEHHAIIGPNGAGKTTLFDLVTGALRPTTGRVYVDGTDVSGLREDQRARRGIVRSFQLTELFESQGVRANLALAVQSTRQRFNPFRARDPAVRAAAEDWLTRLGIETEPTARPATLSHADRKRLEVGTALAADPSVLLLDEPTSGVPGREATALVDLIADVARDRTVLLIEHDVELALRFADRVTVLERGEVIAQGTPSAILDDEAVTAAYLGGGTDVTLD